MRQHLRVLLLGTATLLGTTALAVAQPGPGSGDRGGGYHHGGMDGQRGPMMSPRYGYDRDRGYDHDYGRTNQRGYGASPYHGPHPDYHSGPGYGSGYRYGDQQRWRGHSHGEAHGSHHQYDGYGSSDDHHGGWERPHGPHSRYGQAHRYGHYHGHHGPHGGGERGHHAGGHDGDRWERHSRMRDRRTRDAMGFHGMRIDTNDDGVISPDEAAAHAEMIFVLLDRNMDGVLSPEDRGMRGRSVERDDRRGAEQRRQAEESAGQDSPREAQAQSDRQGSGHQGGREEQRSSQWGEAFREMDQDDDGSVTMEEFMSYHEERYNELAGDEGEVSPWRYRASWHGFSSDE